MSGESDCRTAPATPGLLKRRKRQGKTKQDMTRTIPHMGDTNSLDHFR